MEKKKALLNKLYKSTEIVQKIIESQMDSLIQDGNTEEFREILIDMAATIINIVSYE